MLYKWFGKRRRGKQAVRGSRLAKKPVIYLFSPDNVDVSVAVTLSPELRFTTMNPIVPVQHQPTGHKVHWDIRTQADGTLTEQATGLELSSLFWEADTNLIDIQSNHTRLNRPAAQDVDDFSLSNCDVSDSDSVTLPVSEVTGYLEKALTGLGLHTEARTSFITFWLPSFLKHKYVALRFIPQATFSRIAPIDIIPKPDIVIRVFMIFKGVSDLSYWPSSVKRARYDVTFWARIVGVDPVAAWNDELFRVLEWGAMEVSIDK
ncbi:hypothetical protein BDZ94DRAFT_1161638 [Collybia nuda]|uniref:Uncharacterized protein n=1 Tax=Collybia nuda TaxID=64659 RepID=A0A9P6CFY0_9AGAR|nr:hypothetical protein BDZ94DRAFT_1161638 [Collybia nuda]